jgi:hypothetical protein
VIFRYESRRTGKCRLLQVSKVVMVLISCGHVAAVAFKKRLGAIGENAVLDTYHFSMHETDGSPGYEG